MPERRLGAYNICLYLAIGFAPFINIRHDVAYFTLSDGFFILCFLMLLFDSKIQPGSMGIALFPWMLSYLAVIGGLYASSLMAGDPVRGMILIAQYSFCFVVIPFVLLRESLREMLKLALILLWSIVVLDVHGIVSFFAFGYRPSSIAVTGGLRLATLIGNANAAACLNAMAIVTVLWLHAIGRIRLLLTLAFLATMGFALVLTSSNTGLIALAIGLICYIGLTFRVGYVVTMLPLLLAPAMLLYIAGPEILPATFQKRVLSAVSSGDVTEAGTFTSRRDLMFEALDMAGTEKVGLLGIGADQFRIVSAQQIPVHNTFLINWTEGGAIALFGWISLFLTGFFLWSQARAQGLVPSGRSAMISCFAILAVFSNATPHIYARYWYVVIVLLMGPVILALKRAERDDPIAHARTRPRLGRM